MCMKGYQVPFEFLDAGHPTRSSWYDGPFELSGPASNKRNTSRSETQGLIKVSFVVISPGLRMLVRLKFSSALIYPPSSSRVLSRGTKSRWILETFLVGFMTSLNLSGFLTGSTVVHCRGENHVQHRLVHDDPTALL